MTELFELREPYTCIDNFLTETEATLYLSAVDGFVRVTLSNGGLREIFRVMQPFIGRKIGELDATGKFVSEGGPIPRTDYLVTVSGRVLRYSKITK